MAKTICRSATFIDFQHLDKWIDDYLEKNPSWQVVSASHSVHQYGVSIVLILHSPVANLKQTGITEPSEIQTSENGAS